MFYRFFCLLMFFMCPTMFSQDVLWELSLGGKNSEYLLDLVPTGDNGFLVGGATQSTKGGDISQVRQSNYDGWLWKMKANGTKEWDMRFSGDGDNYLKSINHTIKDGGFILGLTSSSNKDDVKTQELSGKSQGWIIKLNAARGIQWQSVLGGKDMDDLIKVVPLENNKGHIILLNSNSDGGGNKTVPYFGGMDMWVVQLSSEGEMEWQASFGGEYDDFGADLIASSDGNYLIGGYSNSPVSGNKTVENFGGDDYWLIKIDSKGEILWQKSYGSKQHDQLKQIVELPNNKYRIYGSSNSLPGTYKNSNLQSELDYWFLDLDEHGEKVQEWSYSYGNENLLVNAKVEDNGDMLIGGTTARGSGAAKEIMYLGTLFNKKGEVLWERSFSGKGENTLTKFIQSRDGAFIFAGTSDSKPNQEKSQHKGMNDFWVVKVSNSSSDSDEQEQIDSELQNIEKFKIEAIPNPVSSFTNIIIPFDFSTGTLKLYDSTGKFLLQRSIKYQTEALDLSGYPPGVYIVSVKTNTRQGEVNVLKE